MDCLQHTFSQDEYQVFADLISFVDPSKASARFVEGGNSAAQSCYKALYEAAETRYERMKALVVASVSKQTQLQKELRACRFYEMLHETKLQNYLESDIPAALWTALDDLKRVREENARLAEMNHGLRVGVKLEMPSYPENRPDVTQLRAQLSAAQQQISAMDLELNRMGDRTFDYEERIREYEDVLNRLMGLDPMDHDNEGTVPPRYHPMVTCVDVSCRQYCARLRSGLKQSVAEAYVRDRSVRIYGHFRRNVEPIEELRVQKDLLIEKLELRLARLECAAFCTAGSVGEDVDAAKVAKLVELERLRSDVEQVTHKIAELRMKRDALEAEVIGLQDELGEAKSIIAASKDKAVLCRAELQQLEKERRNGERIWGQIQDFLHGKMGKEYNDKMSEYKKLEHEIEVLRSQVKELVTLSGKDEEHEEEESSGSEEEDVSKWHAEPCVRASGNSIFIICRCGKRVVANGIQNHVANAHPGFSLCPMGCGFLSRGSEEMLGHVRTASCTERATELRRFNMAIVLD